MTKHKAFTLVEVLVVTAVIATLLGILVPSLRAGRESARCVVCGTNLRQLQLALDYYATDHKDWFSCAEPENRESVSELHWFMNECLLRYVNVPVRRDGDGQLVGPQAECPLLTCPTQRDPARTRDDVHREYALSYALNVTLGIGGRPDNDYYRRRAEFRQPCNTLAFTDARGKTNALGVVSYHSCPQDNFEYRHSDGVNVVFLDSHVERVAHRDIPFGFWKRFNPFWSAKKPCIRR